MLRQVMNLKTHRKEWALVSRSKPHRVLKYFGVEKPSEAEIAAEEARVNYYKNRGG